MTTELSERRTKSTETLAKHLAAIRADRGLSLRQVEELTNKLVSNAYLSQIEKGKIQHPSPNILYSLAQVYKTSYEQLMEMAGYINVKHKKDSLHGRAATFAALNLTEAEENELLEYLKFRRAMQGKNEG
jgi:HTH-type transcriptional regulator, competence development regulator